MSLINEALKKAQRQRQPETPPPFTSQVPLAPRARPRSTHSLILLGAGGLLLVVLSVVVTLLLLNRSPSPVPSSPIATKPASPAPNGPAEPSLPAVATAPAAVPPAAGPALTPAPLPTPPPAPAIALPSPVINPPAPAKAPSPLPAAKFPSEAVKAAPAPSIFLPAEGGTSPPPALATAPAVSLPPARPSTEATRDDRAQAFVDNLRVAGLRAFGDGARVLMNDRVFRVGDIVDRNLGLRLSRVEPGMLTFTDVHGFNYLKRL